MRTARVHLLRAPLVTPFRIATGQHDRLENVGFELELQGGLRGHGEAGVASHITGETLAQTRSSLERAATVLPGVDLSDYRRVCLEFRPLFEANHAALAAFEMAVLDAVARGCGFPFWRFFGDRPARLASDITIVLGTVEEAETAAHTWRRRGFRDFKIKIGQDETLDLARVCAVARIARGGSILLDANQGYDAPQMLRFVRALRRRGVRPALLEQPVPREDWDGLARLTRESAVPVCADESVRSLGDAVRLARLQAANVVNLKFMKTGILEAVEIARFARAQGWGLMIGAMLEGALAITAAAHCAAGLGGFDFIDLDTTFFVRGPLARSPYLDPRGRFDFRGAGPGIGVEPRTRGRSRD